MTEAQFNVVAGDQPIGLPRPEPLTRGSLNIWRHEGVTLMAGDGAGTMHGGRVGLDELEEFIGYVRKHMPHAVVVVHNYGLRAVHTEGVDGPRMEWRDWD